jgi:hypothetical protein
MLPPNRSVVSPPGK